MPESLTTDPGYRLEYVLPHEAWYAEAHQQISPQPEVTITKAAKGGGCAWEFQLVEYELSDTTIQARIFEDAFAAFVELAPLFTVLAAERPKTLAAARAILDRLGFVDATERVQAR
jgi:hypothetical protein